MSPSATAPARTAHPEPLSDLVAAMQDPATYPHKVWKVELIETHISWVFVAGPYVYKIKKPVGLPFIDQREAARRHELCSEEVRLNRRLAFGMYLGVRGLARRNGRWHLTEERAPDAEEFAVKMRRFDEDRTLAALLKRSALEDSDIIAVAERIAAFHRDSAMEPTGESTETLVRSIQQNLSEVSAFGGTVISAQDVAGAQRFVAAFLAVYRPCLEARAAAGLVTDGHGDLRAEHVILGHQGVEVFDCVEFDPALRHIDVGVDLAFLAMDLEAAGGRHPADALVDAYRRAGGDPGGDPLLAFFIAYRAWVRCKVACTRRAQLDAGSPEVGALRTQALGLVRLARQAAWRARGPLILVVCGPTASGKTFLATRLAQVSGLEHLNSDAVRKRQWGRTPTDRAPDEAYDQEANTAVYAELGRQAAAHVDRGGLIVDGTFRHRRDREAFVEAYGQEQPAPVFVECRAWLATVRGRAAARWGQPDSVSDADPRQVDAQLAEFAALDEVDAARHITVRTDRPVAEVAEDVEALLDTRLAAGVVGG